MCIVHNNCIITLFNTSCHIKKKCVEFFFFIVFFFSTLKTRFLYVTSNNDLKQLNKIKNT